MFNYLHELVSECSLFNNLHNFSNSKSSSRPTCNKWSDRSHFEPILDSLKGKVELWNSSLISTTTYLKAFSNSYIFRFIPLKRVTTTRCLWKTNKLGAETTCFSTLTHHYSLILVSRAQWLHFGASFRDIITINWFWSSCSYLGYCSCSCRF